MAERVLFNPEKEHETRDWREIEPGDMVWLVPDPDENGTIDPDEIKLVLVPKQIGKTADGAIDVVKDWSSMTKVSQSNLYLSDPKPPVVDVQKESND